MDPNEGGFLSRAGYWFEHPFTQPVSFRTIALVLALFIIAIWLLHDGHRIALEAVGQ